eukprot:CAMPEP_0201230368 /NCGR_PEP_ID=MMETSP0852-20130820/1704_1 /ASSEMBLY_ACC=CAM_ASM_000632 /TAXON_ID=183588 /ORGANISM="Pseudo-nitzschia fraudulenta, Strain WWA7" /LENGTH=112 /DNA_ID=CAMNT_0047521067 /DNA_START=38 /DNA_END=378 /DNA_ORIENTATION=+
MKSGEETLAPAAASSSSELSDESGFVGNSKRIPVSGLDFLLAELIIVKDPLQQAKEGLTNPETGQQVRTLQDQARRRGAFRVPQAHRENRRPEALLEERHDRGSDFVPSLGS